MTTATKSKVHRRVHTSESPPRCPPRCRLPPASKPHLFDLKTKQTSHRQSQPDNKRGERQKNDEQEGFYNHILRPGLKDIALLSLPAKADGADAALEDQLSALIASLLDGRKQ